jgi:hypothetical protein
MKQHRVFFLAATAAFALTLGGSVQAGNSIGIRFFGSGGPPTAPAMDPSEVAGVIPQANWNQLMGPTNYGVGPLNDANGVAIAATSISYGCNNTWNTGITDAPGDARLMGSYLDSGSTDFTVVLIQGLSQLTTGSYDVYVYSNGGAHTGRHGFWMLGGFGGVTKECTDFYAFDPAVGYYEDVQDGGGGNYLHFPGVTGDTVLFLITAQNPADPTDNGFRAPTNAIQIVAN